MADEVRRIVVLRDALVTGVKIEAGISTAFGCTLQGTVAEVDVNWLAEQLIDAGVDETDLSDTTGMANPKQVRRLFERLRAAVGESAGAAHMHNTRGLRLANCLAAFDVGARTSTLRSAGSAAAPTRRGLRATSSRRTWCSCSRSWARRPTSTPSASSARASR